MAATGVSTVASMSGVGSGVGGCVGTAACVAEMPAATVAPMSGVGTGVAVGLGGAAAGSEAQAKSVMVAASSNVAANTLGKIAVLASSADKVEPPASVRGYRRAC